MSWDIEYLDEAKKDMKRLDHSVLPQVLKGIRKVAQNPVSIFEGGNNLTGLIKIRFRDLGIRVVYKLIVTDTVMKIIVVSARTDEQVYKEAAKRRSRHEL